MKYLVNEYYSRDLSVKTKSAKYTKMRRGEYKSGNYTYGYKAGDNGEQIIDEKAAETVKMIFELTADGKSAAYISKLLFDKNIPTPAQYKGIKGNYGSRFPNCKYWSIFHHKPNYSQRTIYGDVCDAEAEGTRCGQHKNGQA